MRINFFGAARTVTGSCYLLEHEGHKFMVDCGMFQGSKAIKEHNYSDFPFVPSDVEFILLTHAHIDHSGLIPKLYRYGYKNPIYASTATVALAEIMLPDSGYIQEMEVERKNRKLERSGEPLLTPIYTAADAMAVQSMFIGVDYEQEFSPVPGIKVVLHDAGHILGSAMVELHYTENGTQRNLVFTGDLGRRDQAIICDPYRMESADYLVIESTYGNRLHECNAEDEVSHMAAVINDTFRRGGNVVIPAFAVDRTQDILMMLNVMQQENMLPPCKVYVDSPLAVKATDIFAKFPEYFDNLTTSLFKSTGKPPFILDNLVYSRSVEDSQRINTIKSGAIIISASGMADAGRIKHHLKHNLWRKESAVIFCGYQAEGTLGRRLIDGESHVTIHGEEIDVRAQIFNLDGFSAHADRDEMLTWLRDFKQLPSRIFVTHGENESAESFAALISQQFNVTATAPQLGDMYDLTDEPPKVEHNESFAQQVLDENLLADINTSLQKITLKQDIDKLIRVRDFLRSIS